MIRWAAGPSLPEWRRCGKKEWDVHSVEVLQFVGRSTTLQSQSTRASYLELGINSSGVISGDMVIGSGSELVKCRQLRR
jgi:hypothetical protein